MTIRFFFVDFLCDTELSECTVIDSCDRQSRLFRISETHPGKDSRSFRGHASGKKCNIFFHSSSFDSPMSSSLYPSALYGAASLFLSFLNSLMTAFPHNSEHEKAKDVILRSVAVLDDSHFVELLLSLKADPNAVDEVIHPQASFSAFLCIPFPFILPDIPFPFILPSMPSCFPLFSSSPIDSVCPA